MHSTASPEETLLRRTKWTYIVALLLIAALSLGSHLIMDSIIYRQTNSARLINLSGRQRMLSQRIVKIAMERALHRNPNARHSGHQAMLESIANMEAVHNGLLHGSAELRLTPPPPSVLDIYTGPRWKLDAKVQQFLLQAHALAERPDASLSIDDPDLIQLEDEARSPLLNALDAVVDANQDYSERAIDRMRGLLALFTTCMLLILLAEAFLLFRPLFNRLSHHQQKLLFIGRTDPLTGCFNRRAFEEFATAAIDRARRSAEPLSLLSLDLDHFKQINDTHGHAAGDLVLETFATTLNQHIRSSDLLCRTGGEEFVLVLPATAQGDLAAVADRFREAVERMHIFIGSAQIRVTVSIGAATLHPTDITLRELLERADLAVYQAKRAGRNRVVLAPTPADPAETLLCEKSPEPQATLVYHA